MARQKRPKRESRPTSAGEMIGVGVIGTFIGGALLASDGGFGAAVITAAGAIALQIGIIAKGVQIALRGHGNGPT